MKIPKPKIVKVSLFDSSLSRLRILHLSDLHIDTKTDIDFIRKLVKVCKSLEYDIATLSGDIIDTNVKNIQKQLRYINDIEHLYWVSGNHDIYHDYDNLKKILYKGICLDNKYVKISSHKSEFILCGLPDRFGKWFGIKRDMTKIYSLKETDASIIFVSHQPKDYKIALRIGAKLFLCGHTHGGQIYSFHYIVRLFQPFLYGLHYKNIPLYM